MFGSTSNLTPQQQAEALIREIKDTRTAFDNATVDEWRGEHLGMIGLRLSALVRIAKTMAETSTSTNAVRSDDVARCDELEVQAKSYLNTSARVAAQLNLSWPNDVRREIDAQTDDLITQAGSIVGEAAQIVARHGL